MLRFLSRILVLVSVLSAAAATLVWRGTADLAASEVSSLQLLLLAIVAAILEKHPLLAGAILGLMLAAKPNVILIVAAETVGPAMLAVALMADPPAASRAAWMGSAFFILFAAVVWRMWRERPLVPATSAVPARERQGAALPT